MNLDKIQFVGYAFQIEMKFAAWKLGFKIKEVPIIFQDRTFGTSKMNKGIIKEGVIGVLKLRWNSLFKNYRKRLKMRVQKLPHPPRYWLIPNNNQPAQSFFLIWLQ